MLTIDKIKQTTAKLGKKYGIKNAYLFGSYARGEATEQSDVDIIIDKGDLKTYDDFADLKYELEDELGTSVDLLTTRGVRPRFYDFIKQDRILLYGTA